VYTRGSGHRHARAGAWRANDHSTQMPKQRKHGAISLFSHVFKAQSLTFTEWSLNANVLLPAWVLRHVKTKNEPIWKNNIIYQGYSSTKPRSSVIMPRAYMVTMWRL
jgi:hypothetical protein